MQSLLNSVRNLFSEDRRERVLLAGVAVLGVLMALFAILFLFGDDGNEGAPADDDQITFTATPAGSATATATRTRSATATRRPTASATADGSATATEDPDAAATSTGGTNQGSSGSAANTPTSGPAATATPVRPAASGLAYCDTSGASNPPAGSVIGLVTVGGATAPAGTIVSLAFDGVVGPSEAVTIEGGAAGYSLNYSSGGADCANQAGAAISVILNGQSFATGAVIGFGDPAFLFSVDAN